MGFSNLEGNHFTSNLNIKAIGFTKEERCVGLLIVERKHYAMGSIG
jgi:hypothetical protein